MVSRAAIQKGVDFEFKSVIDCVYRLRRLWHLANPNRVVSLHLQESVRG